MFRLCIGLLSLLLCCGAIAAPTTYVLHVDAPLSAASTLAELGLDVDRCTHHELRVYASETDLGILTAEGFSFAILDTQPKPTNFSTKSKGLGTYHSHAALTTDLQSYASTYPNICTLTNLGNSVEGKALWALKITDNPGVEEAEPEFKYVSTMHGDEILGVEMCMYLIDYLLTNYGLATSDGLRATSLVDSTEIWIVPLMNPDGHLNGTRYNENGEDLNRNFPSLLVDNASTSIFDGGQLDLTGREPETQHVMEWSAGRSFVQSANIHGGTVVVNYPFDESNLVTCNTGNIYSLSPDDALFQEISLIYAESNPQLTDCDNTVPFGCTTFTDGITNGSKWYSLCGGMQDWHYRYLACNEVTLELHFAKDPEEITIPTYWTHNQESMLAYMEAVHMGIRGVVTDSVTGAPIYAKVTITGNTQPVFSDPDVGDYYRMLLPGSYTVHAVAQGYEDYTSTSRVTVASGTPTVHDIAMTRKTSHSADQDGDFVVSMTEVLRVFQLYNLGEIFCDGDSEDGYKSSEGFQYCIPHDGDYVDGDFRFGLSEILRMAQFYNAGSYHPCIDGEDGFCPGDAP